jgi:hypothetical protein
VARLKKFSLQKESSDVAKSCKLTVLRGVEVGTRNFVDCAEILWLDEFANVNEGFFFDCQHFQVSRNHEAFRLDVLATWPQNVFLVDGQMHTVAHLQQQPSIAQAKDQKIVPG